MNPIVVRMVFGAALSLGVSACSSADSPDGSPQDAGDAGSRDSGSSDAAAADSSSLVDAQASDSTAPVTDAHVGDTGDAMTPAPDAHDGGAATATFSEVYAKIIGGPPGCNGCHTSPNPEGALDMSSKATAYANLVGKPATAAPKCAAASQKLVEPGNAAGSLLYLKVTAPPCGSLMPLKGAPLTATQKELISDWINAGAPND